MTDYLQGEGIATLMDVYNLMTKHYQNTSTKEQTCAPLSVILPWLKDIAEETNVNIGFFDSTFFFKYIFPAWKAMVKFRKLDLMVQANVELKYTSADGKKRQKSLGNEVQRRNSLFSQRLVKCKEGLTEDQRKIPEVVALYENFLEHFPNYLNQSFNYLVYIIQISPQFHFLAVTDIENRQMEIVRTQLPYLSIAQDEMILESIFKTNGIVRVHQNSATPSRFHQMRASERESYVNPETQKSQQGSTLMQEMQNGSEAVAAAAKESAYQQSKASVPSYKIPPAPSNGSIPKTKSTYRGASGKKALAQHGRDGSNASFSNANLSSFIDEIEEVMSWFNFFVCSQTTISRRIFRQDYPTVRCTALTLFYLDLRIRKGLKLVTLGIRLGSDYDTWINTFVSHLSLLNIAAKRIERWTEVVKTTENGIFHEILQEVTHAAELGHGEWTVPIDLSGFVNICTMLERQGLRLRITQDETRRLSRIVWDPHII